MKKYIVAIIGFIISGLCFLGYNIKGSYLTSDGLLVEPFYLVAIGSTMALLSLLVLSFLVIRNFIKGKNTVENKN